MESQKPASTSTTAPYRVGKWLPSDQATLNNWVRKLIDEVDGTEQIDGIDEIDAIEEDLGKEIPGLQPPVQDLKNLIETDSEVNMFFHQMFAQVPWKYQHSPDGKREVRGYRQMLRLINAIMTKAPEFNTTGMVGTPITAILDWPMGTVGGYAAFLNDKVNAHFKNILNKWGQFLKSADSCYVLNNDPVTGWLGEQALSEMPHFVEWYQCEPSKPYFGFTSWDDFFTREFRDGVRPVASPDDDKVICNACESGPYLYQYNVKRRDRFWIKSQPYSIIFMLANDPLAEQFVGGTVYQAFLSALLYHRWHSPVDGKIVKAYIVPGTYYAEAQSMGFDITGQNESQGYITEVATRALIFIEADNPYIGLMCFMAVGMVEISSCDITVYEGQRVKKGQQLGMFHFGGSTHCLIFRPGVDVTFHLHDRTPSLDSKPIHINKVIATVPIGSK